MTLKQFFLLNLAALFLVGCIGDDFIFDEVEPEIRITNKIDSIQINKDFQLEFIYLNNIGNEETVEALWSSDDINIATVSEDGLLTGVSTGSTNINVRAEIDNSVYEDQFEIVVSQDEVVESSTIVTGNIATTTFYKLEGDFSMEEQGDDLVLSFEENYCASSSLPGLYVYLSNNKNSIANALEIGKVTIFNGAHEYTIPNTKIADYAFIIYFCKPFNVKVGDGTI